MIRHGFRGALAVLGAVAIALTGCTAAGASPSAPTVVEPVGTVTVTVPVASASASASVPASIAQRATAIVNGMTASQRAGTLLMTAGTVQQLPGLAPLVKRYALGGVMVRGRSAAGTRAVAAAFRPVLAAAPRGLPLLTATDQEGGYVQVLSGPGFARIPTAVDQARLSPATLRKDAAAWGRSLAAAGVRLDLAPVADVPCASTVHDNPPVADLLRNYGTDPVTAGTHVAAFVDGMRDAGVATTVKHFPGLGCVRKNTDTSADVVDTVTTTTSPRLASFAAGIRAGAPFAMVSSASYSQIDKGVPALFSAKVIGLLRGRMGFGGVVISDDTGLAVALKSVPLGDRVTRFVAAGGDLLLDVSSGDVPGLHAALVAKAAHDPAFAAKVRAAAVRVVEARLRVAS